MDIGITMKPKKVNVLRLKDILRLHHEAHLSHRQIARSLKLSIGVISKYITRARLAGVKWPLPPDMGEEQLLILLQPKRSGAATTVLHEPDFAKISVELSRKGMTRQLLWEEYAEQHPKNHYSYSRFTVLYRAWHKTQRLSMRQTHRAGDNEIKDIQDLNSIKNRILNVLYFHSKQYLINIMSNEPTSLRTQSSVMRL